MALPLLFSRRATEKLSPESLRDGWINLRSSKGFYPVAGGGVYRVTVSGKNCAGLRILDWNAGQTAFEASPVGNQTTLTAVVNLTDKMVIRCLNPTSSTEVYMTVEKLSPPPYRRNVASVTHLLRRCLAWR